MKRKLPQFEPQPYVWTRIQERINDRVEDRMSPLVGWSLTMAIAAMLVLGIISPLNTNHEDSNPYPSHNTLYHE